MACVYLRSLLRSAPCPNVTCIKVEESAAGHSHWGKEETLSTITLTCSTAVWLISWINHHLQGLHSSSITPFAFLADFFLLHPSILSVTTFFSPLTPPAVNVQRGALPLFITQSWHFWTKLHTCTDWTLSVRVVKHRSSPTLALTAGGRFDQRRPGSARLL